MKKYVPARQRTPSSRQTIFPAFVLSTLALCSLFAVKGRAQQDDRGIVVKTEMALGSGVGLGRGGFALTPDGAQLAFVASDPGQPGKLSVRFVEFATGREARSLSLPDDFQKTAGSHLAFTPDGRLVAAAQAFANEGTQLVEEGLKKGEADAEPKDGTLLAKEWLDFAAERVPQMQLEKMRQARGLGLNLAFIPDAPAAKQTAATDEQGLQRPRAFYRRELESNPLVVAKKP